MSNDANVLVHYTGNADPTNATGALTLTDRPDLIRGQAGYVTDDELTKLNAAGYHVAVVTESDLEELGVALPESSEDAAPAPPAAPASTGTSGSLSSSSGSGSSGSSSSSGSAS